MRKALEYVVYSNLWISCGGAAFCSLYYILNEVPFNFHLLAFLFCSTLLTYTYQRYEKLRLGSRVSGPRMLWMKQNSVLVLAILSLGVVGTIVFAFFLNALVLIILGAFGTLSFFYVHKVKLGANRRNLRDISYLKIILIATVWTGSCYLLPFIQNDQKVLNFLLPFIALFLFIIGITIPFDIRDLGVDEKSKRTIPQLIGEKLAKILGAILLLISAIILKFQFPGNELSIAITYIISIVAILLSHQNRQELYFSFFLDGLLILMPLGFYLLKSL